MPGGVDKVELIARAVLGIVVQGDTLCLDGNAAFFFDVQAIQNLICHFAITEPTTQLDETISQRGFTMIDMGDNGEISNVAQIGHELDDSVRQGKGQVKNKLASLQYLTVAVRVFKRR